MHLQIDIPGQATRTIALRRKTLVIGRDPAADVAIDRADIPELVCQVQALRGGQWIVRLPRDGRDAAPREQPLVVGLPLSLGPLTVMLVDGAARETWKCPGCSTRSPGAAVLCTRCGFDRRVGRCIGPAVLPAGITPPPVSDAEVLRPPMRALPDDRRPVVVPFFELGGPLLAALLSVAVLAAHAVVFPPDEVWRLVLRLALTCVLNGGSLVACVLLASHWGAVEFGDVHRGLLKCMAIVLVTLALGQWVEPFVTKVVFSGLPAGAPPIIMATGMLLAGVYLIVPFPLLKFFFRLDLVELLIVVGAQCVVTLVTVVLLGWLL